MNRFMLFLTECPSEYEVLRVIYFVLLIIKIVLIVVPIGVIVMTGLDLFKSVAASKEDDMKKNFNIAIKRIIYCVCVFFVPTIVNVVFSILGDMGVDYATYVSCANLEDINVVIENRASELVAQAKESLDYSDYTEAVDVVSDIKDDSKRKQYESELDSIKSSIDQNRPVVDDEPNNPVRPGNGGSSSDDLDVDYPDEVVENLAAFIASENGWNPEGFFAQLVTGSVYINNYYYLLDNMGVSNKEYTLDNMCRVFSYKNPNGSYAYTPNYCNLTFDKVEGYRKSTISQVSRNQLMIVAKLLLSKKFVIPKHIQYEVNAGELEKSSATAWGTASVGDGFPLVYYGYSNYNKPLQGIDVYGNEVSTNFGYYQNLARDYYKKYVEK